MNQTASAPDAVREIVAALIAEGVEPEIVEQADGCAIDMPGEHTPWIVVRDEFVAVYFSKPRMTVGTGWEDFDPRDVAGIVGCAMTGGAAR